MDSQTHIELAQTLLKGGGASPALAICSLFPQIDRRPPPLHRLYAHTVFKAKPLTDLGLRVLFGGSVTAAEKEYFAYRRFKEEESRLIHYLSSISSERTRPFDKPEMEAGILSFVSHLYLDTYNQPTQAFAPLSVYPSGQWELWKRLGDFRLRLYTTDTIDKLRKELFDLRLWNQVPSLIPSALTQAMLSRMVEASLKQIQNDIVDQAMRSLEIEASQAEVKKAFEFLVEFENELSDLHEKYLPTALSTKTNPSTSLATN